MTSNSIANKRAFVPFCVPTIEEEEIAEVLDTLKSGWLTTGKKVLRFEDLFRSRLSVKHAMAVTSATSGWLLVAKALGIGPGDEVIVPAITWPSMANVVELLGGTVVLADVDNESLQILPESIEQLITQRTRAIVPVHFAGAPCNLDAIKQCIGDKPIRLVEDAAHALGTYYKGREIGSDSDIAIFSFHPIKNITTGEGGMIVCKDDELAEKIKLLRFHGISKDAWKRYSVGDSPEFEVIEPGYKSNMTDIQAALGLSQMPKLDRFNEQRRKLAELYNNYLEEIDGITPLINDLTEHVHAWHLYIVKLNLDRLTVDRNEFIRQLGLRNIGAGIHFPSIHRMKYYREKYQYSSDDLPNATILGQSILSLPLYPNMTTDQVKQVVEEVQDIINNNLKHTEI